MSPRETPKETLGYWGYRGAEWLAMSLPERTGRRVFETLGRVAYHRLAGVRATVAANQARVLGADPTDDRVSRATREAFELYARFWFDAFRIRAMRLIPDRATERASAVEISLGAEQRFDTFHVE